MTLTAVAKALRRQREAHAEAERRRAEERKWEAEEAAQRAEYNRRPKAVESLAHSWERSKLLQSFAERLTSLAENDRGWQ